MKAIDHFNILQMVMTPLTQVIIQYTPRGLDPLKASDHFNILQMVLTPLTQVIIQYTPRGLDPLKAGDHFDETRGHDPLEYIEILNSI